MGQGQGKHAAAHEGDHALPPETLVDGGALVPQGVYTGAQDYNHAIVQRYIHDRKLAPFYKSFEDEDPDAATIAQAYPHLAPALRRYVVAEEHRAPASSASSSSSHSAHADRPSPRKSNDAGISNDAPETGFKHTLAPSSTSTTTAPLPALITPAIASSASTPASTTTASQQPTASTSLSSHTHTATFPSSGPTSSSSAMTATPAPTEPPSMLLPHPPTECPICFLYYPSPLNHTRCCEQPICTECFVQIKRADPNHTNPPSSEPATCPYCMETNFGVVYRPSPNLIGRPTSLGAAPSAPSSSSATPSLYSSSSSGTLTPGAQSGSISIGSIASALGGHASHAVTNAVSARRIGESDKEASSSASKRRKSFGHTDPEVITIDMIRPDWEDKLRQAHAAIARRANRRIIMRQVGDRLIPIGVSSSRAGAELPDGISQGPGGAIIIRGGEDGRWSIGPATGSGAHQAMVAAAAAAAAASQGSTSSAGSRGSHSAGGDAASLGTPARSERGSSRSSRRRDQEMAYLQALGGQDMEEIMLMEAMRLSLLEHEEQQRRQAEASRRQPEAAPTDSSTDAPGASDSSVTATMPSTSSSGEATERNPGSGDGPARPVALSVAEEDQHQ